jgi:Fe(3+) dicitrate transport protein
MKDLKPIGQSGRRVRAGLAGILLGIGPGWLNGVPETDTYELAPVEVIGTAESLFRLPGSGYRVDGQEMEAYQLADINRLLERVPGVYFREEDGYGLIANISLRGVDTSRSAKLTLMEDGLPTAPAPYSAPAAYYTPALGRMAGIEVLKGTSQIRYGPHTTGGVINYLSTPLPGKRAGYLRLGIGSDGERLLHGWLGERAETGNGTLDFLAEYYRHESDGYREILPADGYGGSGETGFDRDEGMLKGAWTSSEGRHRLEFKAGITRLEADISYLGLSETDFAENPYSRYAASREDVLHADHDRTYLRYALRLGPDWNLSWTGYYKHFHRNWYKLNDIRDLDLDGDGLTEGQTGGAPVRMGLSEAIAGAEAGSGLEALKGERAALFRVRANNRDYRMAGSELIVRGNLESGEWSHQPRLGIRYHDDRIRRYQWHDLYAQDRSGTWGAPTQSVRGSDGNRRQETRSTAFYLEDEMSNDRWIIRPGIRFEYLQLAYEEFATDGSGEQLADEEKDMTVGAAGIATTYLMDEQSALFFNLYRGFSVPDPRSAINGGIEEEVSNTAEVGLRRRSSRGAFSGELVAFYTHYRDLIVIDNIGSGATGSNDPVTENVGEVDSYGLELLLSGNLHESESGAWRIPVHAAATWTVAELDGDSRSTDVESIFSAGKDGSRLPYIPEFQASLSVGLEWDKLSTGLFLSWRDRTYSTASETAAPVNPLTGQPDARYGEIDSVFLMDWNLHYRLSDQLTLFATVKNLLDREHLVSRHPHGARAGAPRRVNAGLTWTF